MRGVEGGIPYGVPPRPLTVHFTPTIIGKPVCATTAWHYQTSTNPEHVTCSDCRRIVNNDITEEVPVVEYDVTEHVATCTQPIPLCYTCSAHFNLKEYPS